MEKIQRRLLAEYVSREMMEALDVGVLLDIESNLMRSLQRTLPGWADESRAETVRRILRRAWRRVGEDVLCRMAEAEMYAGRDPDRDAQPFSGSGILGP